jgi:hypothetical protein
MIVIHYGVPDLGGLVSAVLRLNKKGVAETRKPFF